MIFNINVYLNQIRENFLFKIGDKKYLHVGESIFTFSTISNINKYGFKYGYNDIKFPFAYDKTNIYYMLEKKYEPIDQYKKSTNKDEYSYLYRNDKTNGKNYKILILFINKIQVCLQKYIYKYSYE